MTNLSQLQKYIPAAPANDQSTVTVQGAQIPIGSISFSNPAFTNTYNALVSLDYNMSDKDQLRGRWIYNKVSAIATAEVPAFNATAALHPINNIDLSVKKRFNFTERWALDIGAQMFNIFNHPQWTGGSVDDVGVNSFTAARNDLVPSDPLFGRFDQFYSSNSRVVQLFAHITF